MPEGDVDVLVVFVLIRPRGDDRRHIDVKIPLEIGEHPLELTPLMFGINVNQQLIWGCDVVGEAQGAGLSSSLP